MAVHDVGARAPRGHLEVHAQGPQGGVGAGQPGRIGVGDDARLVVRRRARRPEAVHPYVCVGTQVPDQVLDVHPGAAVHIRRVLPGEQVDAEAPGEGRRVVHSRNTKPQCATFGWCRTVRIVSVETWLHRRSSQLSWLAGRANA